MKVINFLQPICFVALFFSVIFVFEITGLTDALVSFTNVLYAVGEQHGNNLLVWSSYPIILHNPALGILWSIVMGFVFTFLIFLSFRKVYPILIPIIALIILTNPIQASPVGIVKIDPATKVWADSVYSVVENVKAELNSFEAVGEFNKKNFERFKKDMLEGCDRLKGMVQRHVIYISKSKRDIEDMKSELSEVELKEFNSNIHDDDRFLRDCVHQLLENINVQTNINFKIFTSIGNMEESLKRINEILKK